MKKTISLLVFLSVFQTYNTISAQKYENKEYNATLATELKADDYGMKKYVIASYFDVFLIHRLHNNDFPTGRLRKFPHILLQISLNYSDSTAKI